MDETQQNGAQPEGVADVQGGPSVAPQAPTNDPESQSAAPAPESAPWFQGMPEEAHEKLKGFESADDAIAAMERGKNYVPAKDVAEFNLKMPNGYSEPDAVLNAYKQHCLDKGITPQQAQDLITWQYGLVDQNRMEAMEAGTTELKESWGDKYEANCEQGLVAMQAIDRAMGGELLPAIENAGLSKDPVVSKMFYTLSTLISEASLGAGGPAGAIHPKSREDAYGELFPAQK